MLTIPGKYSNDYKYFTLSDTFTNTINTNNYVHPNTTWINSTPYKHYRVFIENGLDTTYVGVGELALVEAQ